MPTRTPITRATIAIVHNGIIENYVALKQLLTDKGHTFPSQTDTEVLAVLIGDLYTDLKHRNHIPPGISLLQRAIQAALHQVEGTYGIAVICKDEPDTLVVARKGSPLIIGVGDDEYIVASDASAIVEHTTQVIYLNDNEMAVLRPGSIPHHHHRRHRRSPRSSSNSKTSSKSTSWAATSITCSRRSSSSPTPCATACAAGPSSARRGSCSAASPITPAIW